MTSLGGLPRTVRCYQPSSVLTVPRHLGAGRRGGRAAELRGASLAWEAPAAETSREASQRGQSPGSRTVALSTDITEPTTSKWIRLCLGLKIGFVPTLVERKFNLFFFENTDETCRKVSRTFFHL